MGTGLTIILIVVGVLVGAGIGVAIGYVVRKKSAESKIGSAEQEAKKIVDDAIKSAEAKKKEMIVEAKEDILKAKTEADRENKERRQELVRLENRTLAKEEALNRKIENYEHKEENLNKKLREEFKEQLKVLNMGLENRLNDNVEQFSGGQRQALTLLMAVMSKPALLLLDEHTAALDPANAALIMKLTRKFAEEYNLTVMMVTHNMQQALDYGNRLLMMDGGEIIYDVSGDEKQKLTLDDLAQKFREIKKSGMTNDQMVLQ